MNKAILAWINCYGAWDPINRSPVETIGYDQYLDGVVRALGVLDGRLQAVYIAGGMYDSLGKTECETVAPELLRRLRSNNSAVSEIAADEMSVTSIGIARTFLQTWQEKHSDTIPLLFCDQVRYATNAYVLEYFIKELSIPAPPVVEMLVPIERLDTHPNSTPGKQAEKLATLREKGVLECERIELEARKEHVARKIEGQGFKVYR